MSRRLAKKQKKKKKIQNVKIKSMQIKLNQRLYVCTCGQVSAV